VGASIHARAFSTRLVFTFIAGIPFQIEEWVSSIASCQDVGVHDFLRQHHRTARWHVVQPAGQRQLLAEVARQPQRADPARLGSGEAFDQ